MARKGTGPKKGRPVCPGLNDDIQPLNMNITFQVPAGTSMKQMKWSVDCRPAPRKWFCRPSSHMKKN